MKKLILLAMVLGLLVSGCGIFVSTRHNVFLSPKGSWVKDVPCELTVEDCKQQQEKDYQNCRGWGSPIQSAELEVIDKCMESKGYHWEREGKR